ncbi:MAG: hypothetical protein HY015_09215 [Bacteroidetes bacterium]|nr:hypothetical protein [Bacteroidota bacterium]MBI3483134.1 hypothetical protein [Bacteroidota bacterium]
MPLRLKLYIFLLGLSLVDSCNTARKPQVTSSIVYETDANDFAEIKLTLLSDSTLIFHFRDFETPPSVFEATGTWSSVGDNFKIQFKKAKIEFNYLAIFEADSSVFKINNSTFRYNKDKGLKLWGAYCPKLIVENN